MRPVEIIVLLRCYFEHEAFRIGGIAPACPADQTALNKWQDRGCVRLDQLSYTTTAKGDAQVRAYTNLPLVEEIITYELPEIPA